MRVCSAFLPTPRVMNLLHMAISWRPTQTNFGSNWCVCHWAHDSAYLIPATSLVVSVNAGQPQVTPKMSTMLPSIGPNPSNPANTTSSTATSPYMAPSARDRDRDIPTRDRSDIRERDVRDHRGGPDRERERDRDRMILDSPVNGTRPPSTGNTPHPYGPNNNPAGSLSRSTTGPVHGPPPPPGHPAAQHSGGYNKSGPAERERDSQRDRDRDRERDRDEEKYRPPPAEEGPANGTAASGSGPLVPSASSSSIGSGGSLSMGALVDMDSELVRSRLSLSWLVDAYPT